MGRLHIIDEHRLHRLRHLSRMRALLLVLASLAGGYWMAQPDRGVAFAQPPTILAGDPATRSLTPVTPWCQSQAGTLRMACHLSLPPNS